MKRIVTIQDISCIGKCSITVSLPIISSMGIETAVIPTAILSTHTAFQKFTYRDLTNDIPLIQKYWLDEKFEFDAIYTGYLGSIEQIEILKEFFKKFKMKNNFIFVDPVMGDNGKLYKGFDTNFASKMAELCKVSDIIIPNLTEASYMLQKKYKEKYEEKEIKDMLIELSALGPKNVIITGISFKEKELGVMAYNSATKEFFSYFRERINVKYHGTGDVFSSTCVGALTNGYGIKDSIKIATDYTWKCIKDTFEEKQENAYGVNFEKNLGMIIDILKQ